jgi:hypothetical protein
LRFEGASQPLADKAAFQALLDELYAKEWIVYSKPPFGGPEKVIDYLGRYTHRVAISNDRLVRLEDDHVVFTYKDYAHGSQIREMSLPAEEFIRRFLLHVLPQGYVRIRYYGLLAPRHRQENLALCRKLLGQPPAAEPAAPSAEEDWRQRLIRLTGVDPLLCPHCQKGTLRLREQLPAERRRPAQDRAPP